MRGTKSALTLAVATIFLGVLTGCTMKFGELSPNSHFAYPNSNITPLGRVSAETSRTSVFSAHPVDQEMLDEVLGKALKEKGGDLMINYKLTTEIVMIPIPMVPIFTTTLKIVGTAAKMTIGKQELK